jgi:hypothetical protein
MIHSLVRFPSMCLLLLDGDVIDNQNHPPLSLLSVQEMEGVSAASTHPGDWRYRGFDYD